MERWVGIFVLVGAMGVAWADEDVVYLKNGSVIRGTIVEVIPPESVQIRLDDGSVLSFRMASVLRIAKASEAEKGVVVAPQRRMPRDTVLFGGLQASAHSRIGTNWPFVGGAVFVDRRFRNPGVLKTLEGEDEGEGEEFEFDVGLFGSFEYSFNRGEVFGERVEVDLFVAAALVYLGFDLSGYSSLRVGGGVSLASAGFDVFGVEGRYEGVNPTVGAVLSFHPRSASNVGFGLNFSVRTQGDGVMFALSPGVIGRGVGR